MSISKEKVEVPVVKQKDAAILREGLAAACKYVSPQHAKHLMTYLQRYAKAVAEYCECPQQSWVPREGEGMFACLDCGKREKKADPDLALVGK